MTRKNEFHRVGYFLLTRLETSLLCILSKVLESTVYSKIIDFVQDALCQHQFGFLRNRSSVSQLLITFSNIISNCESGLPTDQVVFDFRKAFDSVSHSILLFKLWRIGITGPLWCWFRNYLSNRQHFVQLDGFSSSLLPEYLKVVYLAPFSSWSL